MLAQCLFWINNTAKYFKVCITHHVKETHTHLEPRLWSHVSSSETSANVGTRPISAQDLKESELWWNRPGFLKKPVLQWPRTNFKLKTTELKEIIFMFMLLVQAPLADLLQTFIQTTFLWEASTRDTPVVSRNGQ